MATKDDTQRLKALMNQAGVTSYRQLAQNANVSDWQVRQLRAGKATHMRVGALAAIASALQISLALLLEQFGVESKSPTDKKATAKADKDAGEKAAEKTAALQADYERLKSDLETRMQEAQSQFQTESLRTIESWLVQWPTIAKRAAQSGDALPAQKVLPFVRPIEDLMSVWGVEAIAPVDSQVPYDPQRHQLTKGAASPGDVVTVTHSGATHNGKLLHRAKVKA